jgi:predicted O-linked N-acetylglucosamine transferase (SPINDLY family)
MDVDIAVDLMGFTGKSHPEILAHRPAPVQAQYLGFPGTMGTGFIDYILADRVVIPDEQRIHYSEKVVYLPDSYMPGDSKRPIADRTLGRAQAGLPERGFVFCSFNNSYKFSPEMFDVWMRLLHAVEGSVLWLSQNNPAAVRNLQRQAEVCGIAPERLVFAAFLPAPDEHLARLRLADLFLDTLPYNAHTTASDALWAGLPVLTCAGETFAGRVAASLLHAVGLPELVTQSVAEYEALGLKLARDPAALVALKAKLANNRDTHPLFDTVRFTKHLEAAYRTMWERQQRGQGPAAFAVEPLP